MTLQKLQNYTKIFIATASIILYGLAAFTVGRIAAKDSGQVKGIVTENTKEGVIEKPLPENDIQSVSIVSDSIKFCSNTTYSFQITYPSNWFTTYNNEDQKCTFFAPYSFVVPEFVDGNFVAIDLEVIEKDEWLSTLKFYETPNDFFNIISTKNTEINGRLVKIIEAQTTGEGKTPRGFTAVHYLLFDGEKPIRLSYSQLDKDEDSEKAKLVLEEMVSSLKYF